MTYKIIKHGEEFIQFVISSDNKIGPQRQVTLLALDSSCVHGRNSL